MADSSTVQSRSHLSWIPYLQGKVVSPVSPAATRLISNCQVTGKSASNTQEEISEYVERVTKRYISFTEVCAHGTIPWCGEGERRTIFYKYCPHAVAWSPCYYNSDNYPDLTECQKSLLMPPSAFGPDPKTREIWEKAQAEQQELMRLRKAQD